MNKGNFLENNCTFSLLKPELLKFTLYSLQNNRKRNIWVFQKTHLSLHD